MADNVVHLETVPKPLKATQFVWRDASQIPTRKFLFGRHYIRKFVSATVSPGGVGKSSLILAEALSMATGNKFLNHKPKRPFKVWYWNGEDPYDELERRVHGCALQYFIEPSEICETFWLDSGRDSPIKVAEETRDGSRIVMPVFTALEEQIKENKIDCLILDPFVSSHSVSENDNSIINDVVKGFARLADRCDIAIELVHHVRKAREDIETQAEDARGASALVDACRSVRTLTRMPKDIAAEYGVDDKTRKSLFYVSLGKANLGPPSDPDWYRLQGIGIGNATQEDPEDNVGVVVTWGAPSAFNGLQNSDVARVQEAVNLKPYKLSPVSPEYVGKCIARVLGLTYETDKKRIKSMLSAWLKSGLLVEVEEEDEHRKIRSYVRCGKPIGEVVDEARRATA